jgi:hypothetical protein
VIARRVKCPIWIISTLTPTIPEFPAFGSNGRSTHYLDSSPCFEMRLQLPWLPRTGASGGTQNGSSRQIAKFGRNGRMSRTPELFPGDATCRLSLKAATPDGGAIWR